MRFLEQVGNGLVDFDVVEIPVDALREIPQHARVRQRAVTVVADQSMTFDKTVQVVPSLVRKQAAGEPHGAKHVGVVHQSDAPEFVS